MDKIKTLSFSVVRVQTFLLSMTLAVVVPHSEGEPVNNFGSAQEAESHAKSDDAADGRDHVDRLVQLIPRVLDNPEILKVDVDDRGVLRPFFNILFDRFVEIRRMSRLIVLEQRLDELEVLADETVIVKGQVQNGRVRPQRDLRQLRLIRRVLTILRAIAVGAVGKAAFALHVESVQVRAVPGQAVEAIQVAVSRFVPDAREAGEIIRQTFALIEQMPSTTFHKTRRSTVVLEDFHFDVEFLQHDSRIFIVQDAIPPRQRHFSHRLSAFCVLRGHADVSDVSGSDRKSFARDFGEVERAVNENAKAEIIVDGVSLISRFSCPEYNGESEL